MTVQQDLIQPVNSSARVTAYDSARTCDSSARFKTTSRQFSYGKITLHTVQLEPVTIQQDLRQPVDSLTRVKSPCLQLMQLEPVKIQQDLRQSVDSSTSTLHIAQLEPVTIQQDSRQAVDSLARV